MCWNKQKKKYLVIFLCISVILMLLCLGDYGIRYYNTPMEEKYEYMGTGMLVSLKDFGSCEAVSVEIRGKTAHYVWKNQEDYVQGNVWMNVEKIFGKEDIGITALFIDTEPYYSCISSTAEEVPGNMFLISKDLKNVLCGVRIHEEEYLLVMPAEDKEAAAELVRTAAEQSQGFSQWLSDAYAGRCSDWR